MAEKELRKAENQQVNEKGVNRSNKRLLSLFDPFGFDDDLLPAFDGFGFRPFRAPRFNDIMKTDIKDDGKEYEMTVEVPGIDKKNIKVSLDDGYLTINANTDETNKENGKESGDYVVKERLVGSYQRSWYVGDDLKVTDIHAKMDNGVLTLTFPKEAKKTEDVNNIVTIA